MVVAVLASPEDAHHILPILETLKGVGIRGSGLKLRDGWENLARAEIEARVGGLSNMLLVCSPASVRKSWFHFAVGVGLGHRSPTVLFRTDGSWNPSRYLERLPVLDGLAELQAFYDELRDEWSRTEERRKARDSLLEAGVSCNTLSFAECVREGDLNSVGLFLAAGLPVDATDRHGVPLLCLAARHHHRRVAEILLDAGASIDLVSEDRGYSPLMDAVQAGAEELVELLIARGAKLDLASKDGQTALVIAVGRNDPALSARLLEKGADADIPDKLGLSARKYARLFGNQQLLALLDSLSHGKPATPEGQGTG